MNDNDREFDYVYEQLRNRQDAEHSAFWRFFLVLSALSLSGGLAIIYFIFLHPKI